MKNKTPSMIHRSVLNIEKPSAFAAILAALRIFLSLSACPICQMITLIASPVIK